MMTEKHIILNGERCVGKTTLIQRLLAHSSLPVSGYVTRSTPRDESGFHGIYIYPADSAEFPMGQENHIGDCNGRERTVHSQVFETLGVAYLQPKAGSIVVMDEIGFMELSSPRFLAAVKAVLDSDAYVLAAVKARPDVPFLNQVREHPKSRVFDITEENREALFESLRPVVECWGKE